MKDKCKNCGKEQSIYDLVQVQDKYPNKPKYKMICLECWQDPDNTDVYVGQIRRITE